MMRNETLSGAINNETWISDEDIPDPNPLPKVPGRYILIRPVKIQAKTKGGIILPDSTQENMKYLTTVGRVLSVGNLAYTAPSQLLPVHANKGDRIKLPDGVELWDKDVENGIFWCREPWCKVGDIVGYAKYAGSRFLYKGVKLILMNDEDIRLIVDNPNDIDPSYNYATA